ncbi:hypothetical protein [Nostoc sp. UHCC 0302]|uniref:hypothetical protein n=1 Tax=Nostoc sp. UHCC 0302 TaxID=3134896 RepID=UPI00311CDA50
MKCSSLFIHTLDYYSDIRKVIPTLNLVITKTLAVAYQTLVLSSITRISLAHLNYDLTAELTQGEEARPAPESGLERC